MCWLVQEKLFLSRKKVFPGGWFHKCSHICCICESGWSRWGDGLNWDSVLVTPKTPPAVRIHMASWEEEDHWAGSLRRGEGGTGIPVPDSDCSLFMKTGITLDNILLKDPPSRKILLVPPLFLDLLLRTSRFKNNDLWNCQKLLR